MDIFVIHFMSATGVVIMTTVTAGNADDQQVDDQKNNVVKLLIIKGDRARTAEGRVGMKLEELKEICEEVGDT